MRLGRREGEKERKKTFGGMKVLREPQKFGTDEICQIERKGQNGKLPEREASMRSRSYCRTRTFEISSYR
jgi:hypothetical protein